MKFICPVITVTEIDRSRDFYEKLLDQKVKFDFGENVTFHGDFAIHLRSHFRKLIDNKTISPGGNNFELYFEYDDVEEIVKRLKENGIIFVHFIQEQPWRQKVVRFYDPDDNIVEIGETLEHLSYRLFKEGQTHDQISNTINMPVEFVIKSIEKFQE